MNDKHKSESSNKIKTEEEAEHLNFPIADMISLEAVVNIMIKKGICNPDELYQEERQVRLDKLGIDTGIAGKKDKIKSINDLPFQNKSSLRRFMSKRKWTRKLATQLFGWEWKKIKIKAGVKNFEVKD